METENVRFVTNYMMTRNTNIWISAITLALKRLHDGTDKLIYFIVSHVMQVYFSIQQLNRVSMSVRPRLLLPVVTGIARRAWQWIQQSLTGTEARAKPALKRTADHIGTAQRVFQNVQIQSLQRMRIISVGSAASLTITIPETTSTERRMRA